MITNLLTMAILESCPKHIMVAYLEKSEGNAEFHEVIDFLARSSIYHALTVHYCQSSGKPVSISEASIRSALLFDDADGIDSLPKQAIFDAIDSSCEANVEPQSDQSPRPSHTPHIPDSIPEVSGGNQGDVGRSRDVVNEEKENADAEVSTKDVLSTAQQKERIEADRLLAKSLQEEEREHSQVEERAKFRRDTIDCFKEDILLNKDQKLYRK
ncbi:hypothetical protein Tco_0786365 [Tanacetum coccineum]